VEAWSLAVAGSGQAADGPDAIYWHFVFPYVTWVPGPVELTSGIATITFTGDGRPNANIGYGPDGQWPNPLTSYRNFYETTEIPDATCGYVETVGTGASVAP
jgi:hypothetical protein